jgi:hypothetical protein
MRFKARANPYSVDRTSPYRSQCRDALGGARYEEAHARGRALGSQAAIEDAARWLAEVAANGFSAFSRR